MPRPALEVADIFRDYGAAWRQANAGHVSLGQLKVMSAIESCRTAPSAAMSRAVRTAPIRRSPTTPAAIGTAQNARVQRPSNGWPNARPTCWRCRIITSCSRCRRIADIAYQNKAVVYDLLFKASAETMLTIAGDPKHLGARIGITSVLHTWGSTLIQHPHS